MAATSSLGSQHLVWHSDKTSQAMAWDMIQSSHTNTKLNHPHEPIPDLKSYQQIGLHLTPLRTSLWQSGIQDVMDSDSGSFK